MRCAERDMYQGLACPERSEGTLVVPSSPACEAASHGKKPFGFSPCYRLHLLNAVCIDSGMFQVEKGVKQRC